MKEYLVKAEVSSGDGTKRDIIEEYVMADNKADQHIISKIAEKVEIGIGHVKVPKKFIIELNLREIIY